ncbi:hypothetical protein ACFSTC_46400 [Nonomuraea ferruginea]
MAGLALYSVIGWVASWVLPYAPTAPLAGLGCYALFSWVADGDGWADRLAPGTGEPYDLFQGLSGTVFVNQIIWLLGVTGALLLGWAALVTRQAVVLAFALLAVLAAGTGVARVLGEPRPAAAQDIAYSCQEWPITVCVHPGMRGGLTELGAAFTEIASRLAETPAAFTRVEQRPLDDPLKPSNGLAPIHVPDLSAGFAEEAVHEYVEALAARCPGRPADGYREIVTAWLRGEPLPGGAAAGARVRRRLVLRTERAPAPRVAAHVLQRLPGLQAVGHPLRRRPGLALRPRPPPRWPRRCTRRAPRRSTRSTLTRAGTPRRTGDRRCHLMGGTDDRSGGSQGGHDDFADGALGGLSSSAPHVAICGGAAGRGGPAGGGRAARLVLAQSHGHADRRPQPAGAARIDQGPEQVRGRDGHLPGRGRPGEGRQLPA